MLYRSQPRNKRAIQAKRHKFKSIFLYEKKKKTRKTEEKDNEKTHHQRAHVRNVQLTFWSQKTSADRQYVFMQSMDDKAYGRPGTREGFSKNKALNAKVMSSDAKQQKLPKYSFAETSLL